MFLRKIRIRRRNQTGMDEACPLAWIDSFAMRNFTGAAAFDDTLPVGDGLLEVGSRIRGEELCRALEAWFRRKGWIAAGEWIEAEEIEGIGRS